MDVRLAFPAFRSRPSDYRSGPLWSRPPSEAFASAQATVVIRAPDGTDRIDRYGKQPDDYEPEELMGPHTLARQIGVVAELGPEDTFDELYEALARFGDELDHEN